MELFVQLTQWTDHLGGAFAVAEIDERKAEHALAVAEASALILEWGNRGAKEDRVTIAKAKRDSDPEVIKARDALDVVYAKRKLLGTIYASADRDAAVVSRELTRRIGRHDREARTGRWTP